MLIYKKFTTGTANIIWGSETSLKNFDEERCMEKEKSIPNDRESDLTLRYSDGVNDSNQTLKSDLISTSVPIGTADDSCNENGPPWVKVLKLLESLPQKVVEKIQLERRENLSQIASGTNVEAGRNNPNGGAVPLHENDGKASASASVPQYHSVHYAILTPTTNGLVNKKTQFYDQPHIVKKIICSPQSQKIISPIGVSSLIYRGNTSQQQTVVALPQAAQQKDDGHNKNFLQQRLNIVSLPATEATKLNGSLSQEGNVNGIGATSALLIANKDNISANSSDLIVPPVQTTKCDTTTLPPMQNYRLSSTSSCSSVLVSNNAVTDNNAEYTTHPSAITSDGAINNGVLSPPTFLNANAAAVSTSFTPNSTSMSNVSNLISGPNLTSTPNVVADMSDLTIGPKLNVSHNLTAVSSSSIETSDSSSSLFSQSTSSSMFPPLSSTSNLSPMLSADSTIMVDTKICANNNIMTNSNLHCHSSDENQAPYHIDSTSTDLPEDFLSQVQKISESELFNLCNLTSCL